MEDQTKENFWGSDGSFLVFEIPGSMGFRTITE